MDHLRLVQPGPGDHEPERHVEHQTDQLHPSTAMIAVNAKGRADRRHHEPRHRPTRRRPGRLPDPVRRGAPTRHPSPVAQHERPGRDGERHDHQRKITVEVLATPPQRELRPGQAGHQAAEGWANGVPDPPSFR
jgi:hypothetical protein